MLVNGNFKAAEATLVRALLDAPQIDRQTWHAQAAPAPTRELAHVRIILPVPQSQSALQADIKPSVPWAEEHFQERVGGVPLNPPPSHVRWPYASKSNGIHMESNGGQFSHTYPERMWSKFAAVGAKRPNGRQVYVPHNGIRFENGDFQDLIDVLVENPWTRQAYLPIWFPEDLVAARIGERVPCSIGYLFMRQANGSLDVEYTIRSCDFIRHFRDDVYMAGRLLQFLCNRVKAESNDPIVKSTLNPGNLYMAIGSLHCFPPDESIMRIML